jgi:hypothetical protein
MREISTAPLIGWSRSFPATPEQAGEARRFLTAILNGHPATTPSSACLNWSPTPMRHEALCYIPGAAGRN